jgi:hypothetical protein
MGIVDKLEALEPRFRTRAETPRPMDPGNRA